MGLDGILAQIVERTLLDVGARRKTVSLAELETRARERASHRRSFVDALRRPGDEDPVGFICEIKKASPSRGLLAPELDPRVQAEIYRDHGATAISVVTEPHFFQGSESFLGEARYGGGQCPILRKDFHVDELQLYEAAVGEADAVLLLGAALSPMQLGDYLDITEGLGLGHLVEVDDTAQAENALKAGAKVIGINNRDLRTFEVDVSRTERVLPALEGTGVVSVAESGIHDRETVLRLQAAGVHALLVGEALVAAADSGKKLLELRGEEQSDG